ncbi:uncharacterized protein BO66DRAFT_401110 [Aspergillus aculeatinus CBS 121060]|uniref:Uncharacterized protein n=1 Tax=Aspergillus aculeatinus CBS 121060 TaxID=1448322 RepID=A0ACD1HBG5_9EURO|nr:hypothetical protein BO66DRAFT_401110 [Aspergillus aculeatinus CBS 121060]RAH70749.1 hypothetical protein BO66DRAFT_401110 [Aspergillus aculeatinus CBS 121060]
MYAIGSIRKLVSWSVYTLQYNSEGQSSRASGRDRGFHMVPEEENINPEQRGQPINTCMLPRLQPGRKAHPRDVMVGHSRYRSQLAEVLYHHQPSAIGHQLA